MIKRDGEENRMEKEIRARARVDYAAHVLVKSAKRGVVKGTIRDIAIEALYLYIEPIFVINEKVHLEIILIGDVSQLTISVAATVVRIDEKGVAMRFSKPLEWWPVFSLFPLRSLDKR